jgi:OOP family OmpA-OmpF porin
MVKTMKRGSGLALWILLTALIHGCAGGLYSDGRGTYLDANGDVVRTYPENYDETVRAGAATLEDLDAIVFDQRFDRSETLVEARTPSGSPLRLHYVREGRNLTVVRVRTGRFGYPGREYSNQFHTYLDANLKRRPKRSEIKPTPDTHPKTVQKKDAAPPPMSTAVAQPEAEVPDTVSARGKNKPAAHPTPQIGATLETASTPEITETSDPPAVSGEASSEKTRVDSKLAEAGDNAPIVKIDVSTTPTENKGNGARPSSQMEVLPTEALNDAPAVETGVNAIPTEPAIDASPTETDAEPLLAKTDSEADVILPPGEQLQDRQRADYVVFFDKDANIPTAEALKIIDAAAQRMQANPDIVIELNGYADIDEDPDEFHLVSESRSLAVKSYLIGKGVEPGRIHADWHGSHFATTYTDDKSQDRRVEIRLNRGL